MLPKVNPTKTNSWKKLLTHYEKMSQVHMKDLFAQDNNRFSNFSIRFQDILFDYSKNIVDQETLKLLLELVNEVGLKTAIEQLFSGTQINETEGRAVMHTALRDLGADEIIVNGYNIVPEIKSSLEKIEGFSDRIISGNWKGFSGKPIKSIVNIGIGGSDLGPQMVVEALRQYNSSGIQTHFVSNVDGTHLSEVLKSISAEETLFIIASKTFTTQETMTNAQSAREWFLSQGGSMEDIEKHFVAVSTNPTTVNQFGISEENRFVFWDWVGGRYSLWSSIGLSIACSIGFKNFKALLNGAHEMDEHFRHTSFDSNIPVIQALIGIWYNNFFGAESVAVLPYDQYLHRFPAYLQQADMESNGKSVDRNGDKIEYQTGSIIWGEPGTNGQHAFFQLLHQGTKLVPCDLLAPAISTNPLSDHHEKLLSNFFAQSEALMKGKTKEEVVNELKSSGFSNSEIGALAPYRVFEGNRPSNSILYRKLTPKTLGCLIAMYEHKIFVQGIIWNVFSFDQWGVELGKKLANEILPELGEKEYIFNHDSSTNGLINTYKSMRNS